MSLNIVPKLERKVRSNDPDTSWEAAASTTAEALSELQVWILAALTEKPMTDGELVDAHLHAAFYGEVERKATPQRVRTARKELTDAGQVEWSGQLSLTQFQRKTQIWRAAA